MVSRSLLVEPEQQNLHVGSKCPELKEVWTFPLQEELPGELKGGASRRSFKEELPGGAFRRSFQESFQEVLPGGA